VTAFQAGCRAFASRGLAPCIRLWREKRARSASFALPAASQGVPTFSPPPAQLRACHLLLESPVPARASRPRRGGFTCHRMREHVVSRAMGNHPASAWSAGVVPGPTHDRSCLPPFSRPLSRSSPLLDRAPRLGLWCADGTSSAQWTIGVPSLHLLRRHREEASKERSMGLCASHASRSSLGFQDVIVPRSQEQDLHRDASCRPHGFWT
jgi:hypothetical protein